MPSFSIPLSGLTASSDELSAIANNLANMNTVGYKATSTQFQDLLYQSLGANGAGDPIQVGLGTSVSSNESIFTQGSPNQTGVDTDMAIDGNGFFVLNNNGEQLYTRAGNFTLGSNGSLESAGGANVMGYGAKTDGTINTNGGIKAITIDQGQQYPAEATSYVDGDMSLDGTAATGYPTAQATSAIQMAANFQTGATTSFSQNETVFDSSGASHVLTYNFSPSSSVNDEWDYSITIPGADVGSASSAVAVTSGTLDFDPDSGALTNVSVDNGEPGTVTSASGNGGPGDVTGISVSGLSGGATLSFDWDIFSGMTSNLAQTTGASTVSSVSQNGYPASSPAFTATIPDVYDAQGDAHTLTINFWKTGTNQWDYTMTIPGSDVGSAATSVQVSAGTLGFGGNGQLTSASVTGGTGKVTAATSGQTGVGNISGITIPSLADGATALNFSWDLFNGSGEPTISETTSTSTSTASGSTSTSSIQAGDGYASGSLQSISVDANGTIQGVFSNGQSRAVAQLAIASFANEEGLELTGSNNFQQTLASGDASIGIAGTAGRGTVEGSVLEESNVDIATEFSNLIVAQQAYQANAKAVTTFDTIAQETLNMQAGG